MKKNTLYLPGLLSDYDFFKPNYEIKETRTWACNEFHFLQSWGLVLNQDFKKD